MRQGRIAAAACFLPLTLNPRLSRELGSRHRASIGITEETDAVAVVVSEESGKISVVVDGELERGRDGKQLSVQLRELLGLAGREDEEQHAEKSPTDSVPGAHAAEAGK
jgi:diadenylate cyclase